MTYLNLKHIKRKSGIIIVGLMLLLVTSPLIAGPYQHLNIYLDADQTTSKQAGLSILQGMRLALAEAGNQIQGIPVRIDIKDHRGSSPRSLRHLKQYLLDPQALAVFGGLHSPPLLAHRNFINSQGILLLNPWAAAGPITRSNTDQNWIFRLSLDDSKAGAVLTQHVIKNDGFRKPFLLLEDTGWGKSNLATIRNALQQRKHSEAGVRWFNWGLGQAEAKIILREIHNSGADVILLIANAPEAITFAKALLKLPKNLHLPIRSHWGITGGNFATALGTDLNKLDLEFLQTKVSFVDEKLPKFSQQVLNSAIAELADINHAADIKAPNGFAHAYDLMRLMLASAERITLSGDITQDRLRLKEALEEQPIEVEGLLKTYRQAFMPYSKKKPDAHEALDAADFTMGFYDEQGQIRLKR